MSRYACFAGCFATPSIGASRTLRARSGCIQVLIGATRRAEFARRCTRSGVLPRFAKLTSTDRVIAVGKAACYWVCSRESWRTGYAHVEAQAPQAYFIYNITCG